MERDALGLIETVGLVAAIEACDAAAKAAAVVVQSAEVTDSTLVTIKFEGKLGAVQAAAEAGAAAAQKVGELIAVHVIPRPDNGLDAILPPGKYIKNGSSGNGYWDDTPVAAAPKPLQKKTHDPDRYFEINTEKLEAMTVTALRQFARKLPKLAIKGREISHASKSKLIAEIKKTLGI